MILRRQHTTWHIWIRPINNLITICLGLDNAEHHVFRGPWWRPTLKFLLGLADVRSIFERLSLHSLANWTKEQLLQDILATCNTESVEALKSSTARSLGASSRLTEKLKPGAMKSWRTAWIFWSKRCSWCSRWHLFVPGIGFRQWGSSHIAPTRPFSPESTRAKRCRWSLIFKFYHRLRALANTSGSMWMLRSKSLQLLGLQVWRRVFRGGKNDHGLTSIALTYTASSVHQQRAESSNI